MLVRATIFANYGGSGHINVVHFQRSDVTTVIYLALAAIVDEFWVDWFRINCDATMHWNKIIIEDRGGNESSYEYSMSRNGVLGPSLQYCPFIAACWNFHTDFGGRHGRGRHYVGGFGHGNNFNDGIWLTSTQNRLDGIATELTNYWVDGRTQTNGWRVVVAARTETVSGHPVTQIVGRSRVATMNTRKLNRGF